MVSCSLEPSQTLPLNILPSPVINSALSNGRISEMEMIHFLDWAFSRKPPWSMLPPEARFLCMVHATAQAVLLFAVWAVTVGCIDACVATHGHVSVYSPRYHLVPC